MIRVLMDTHSFLFMAADALHEFGTASRNLLNEKNVDLLLSPISISEIAVKSNKGDLAVSRDDIQNAIRDLQVTILPYYYHHAQRLFDLPRHHNDPFDRMLIATALAEDIAFMSRDNHMNAYQKSGLRLVW